MLIKEFYAVYMKFVFGYMEGAFCKVFYRLFSYIYDCVDLKPLAQYCKIQFN